MAAINGFVDTINFKVLFEVLSIISLTFMLFAALLALLFNIVTEDAPPNRAASYKELSFKAGIIFLIFGILFLSFLVMWLNA